MQTREPTGERAVEDVITIPRSALVTEDHAKGVDDESYTILRVEAVSDADDWHRPLLTVMIESTGITTGPDMRQIIIEARAREGPPVHFEATQWKGNGLTFEVAAQDLEANCADYALFPAGQMTGGRSGAPVADPARHSTASPVGPRTILAWFSEAEKLAGVAHQPGRGACGLRRVAVDAAKEVGISREALKAHGGWSDTQMLTGSTPSRMPSTHGRKPGGSGPAFEAERGRKMPEHVDRAYTNAKPAQNVSTPVAAKLLVYNDLLGWAWVELNYRPHAYQACALTT